MGYACPVCSIPQRDAEHLANHLAFTAMLRGGDHEAWLDDNVPEWNRSAPRELSEDVADFAEAADYDEVFEDTVHDGGNGGHDHGRPPTGGGFTPASGDLDEEARQVLEEAREMTRRMHADDEE